MGQDGCIEGTGRSVCKNVAHDHQERKRRVGHQ